MDSSAESSIVELLAQVAGTQVFVTLRELFPRLGLVGLWSDLDKVQAANAILKKFSLELIPGTDKGDLESSRRLRFTSVRAFDSGIVAAELLGGESQNLEFKSSLLFDHKRAKCTSLPSELRSDEVLHSALKAIAGLMNTDGGVLYIGVNDSGVPIGIEADYAFLRQERRNADNWELLLRSSVTDKFYRGNTVNDYLSVKFAPVCDTSATVARVEVFSRAKCVFLRDTKSKMYRVYRRQGNRTTEVPIEEFEEFLASRQRRDETRVDQ